MKTFLTCAIFLFVLVITTDAQDTSTSDGSTTWTNKDGQTAIGKQVGIDLTMNVMQLQTKDNKIYNIPLDSLSTDDSAKAKAWKYPPIIALELSRKQIRAESSGTPFADSLDSQTPVKAQISITLTNLSKSTHTFIVTDILVGSTDRGTDESDPDAIRPITYLRQAKLSLKLDESNNDVKPSSNDGGPDVSLLYSTRSRKGGTRGDTRSSSLPIEVDDPFGFVQTFEDDKMAESFVVLVSCLDDKSYFQAKSLSLPLEQYALKNAKSIIDGFPSR